MWTCSTAVLIESDHSVCVRVRVCDAVAGDTHTRSHDTFSCLIFQSFFWNRGSPTVCPARLLNVSSAVTENTALPVAETESHTPNELLLHVSSVTKTGFVKHSGKLHTHLFHWCGTVGCQRTGQRQDCVEVKAPGTTSHHRHVYLNIRRAKHRRERERKAQQLVLAQPQYGKSEGTNKANAASSGTGWCFMQMRVKSKELGKCWGFLNLSGTLFNKMSGNVM